KNGSWAGFNFRPKIFVIILRARLPLERKEILRKIIPGKSSWVGCVSYVDRGALKLFELVKKEDLEGLVVKRKDGKYGQQALWYAILNPTYSQQTDRHEFFQRQFPFFERSLFQRSREPRAGRGMTINFQKCSNFARQYLGLGK